MSDDARQALAALSKARWYALTLARTVPQSDRYCVAVKKGTRDWARRNGLTEDDWRHVSLTEKGEAVFRAEQARRGGTWRTGTVYNHGGTR